MELPASSAGDKPRKHRTFPDPMTYYHVHYLGLTRGELRRRDPSFYTCLQRNRLLGLIPGTRRRDFGDPLAYYQEHYAGLTRGELRRRDSALYQRLREDRLLPHVPRLRKDYGTDPLAYYRRHYAGLTREQLRLQNRNLYEVLRRSGLLAEVPRTARGSTAGPDRDGPEAPADPLAEYQAYYAGWTRGQLDRDAHALYQRLRRQGLLGQIPRL